MAAHMNPNLQAHLLLYAEDFDAGPSASHLSASRLAAAEAENAAPEEAEPSFSLAERDAARAEGLAAGAAAERARLAAESAAASAAARARTLDALAEALTKAREAAREVTLEVAEALAQAVLSLVAAGLPALCAAHGEGEARALLRGLLPALGAEPRITVRLNPRLLEPVGADLAGLDPEIAAAVQLVPTKECAPGDVRVSWESGLCQRNADAACAAVREALASLDLFLPQPALAEAPGPNSTRSLETSHVE